MDAHTYLGRIEAAGARRIPLVCCECHGPCDGDIEIGCLDENGNFVAEDTICEACHKKDLAWNE